MYILVSFSTLYHAKQPRPPGLISELAQPVQLQLFKHSVSHSCKLKFGNNFAVLASGSLTLARFTNPSPFRFPQAYYSSFCTHRLCQSLGASRSEPGRHEHSKATLVLHRVYWQIYHNGHIHHTGPESLSRTEPILFLHHTRFFSPVYLRGPGTVLKTLNHLEPQKLWKPAKHGK